jgi:hypothetical protein
MTIELRQLVLKSTVGTGSQLPDESDAMGQPLGQGRGYDGVGSVGAHASAAQFKEEILAECQAWMQAQLQQLRER